MKTQKEIRDRIDVYTNDLTILKNIRKEYNRGPKSEKTDNRIHDINSDIRRKEAQIEELNWTLSNNIV